MALFGLLASFHGDYMSDRLVRVYSTLIFLALAIVIAVQIHPEKSIDCWVPTYFTVQHAMYTTHRCAKESILYHTPNRSIPFRARDGLDTFSPAGMRMFPIALAAQAFLFLLPWLLWKWVSTNVCNLNTIVKEAAACASHRSSGSESASAISSEMQSLVRPPWPVNGRTGGGYLMTLAFLLTRFLNWVICFVQMGLISMYFNFNFVLFKVGRPLWQPYVALTTSEVLKGSGNETEVVTVINSWTPFPKLVLCDFAMRDMGHVYRHTVDCALGLTETVENCLLVIWLWLIIVLIILSVSGAVQMFKTILWCVGSRSYKIRILEKRLSDVESFSKNFPAAHKFVQEYLKPDVLFLMGMVEEKGSVIAIRGALKVLWVDFLDKGKIQAAEDELTHKL